jgi:hypothetical protein
MAKEEPSRITIPVPEGVNPEDFKKTLEAFAKNPKKEYKDGETKIYKEIEVNQELRRIQKTYYKGKKSLRIQTMWRTDENQDWQFGKATTFEYENIDELIEGLQLMKADLEEHPNG